MACRYDLRRLEIKGALSDRALAAALPLAVSPLHSSLPAAPRDRISEELVKLLQATGTYTIVSSFISTPTPPSVNSDLKLMGMRQKM